MKGLSRGSGDVRHRFPFIEYVYHTFFSIPTRKLARPWGVPLRVRLTADFPPAWRDADRLYSAAYEFRSGGLSWKISAHAGKVWKAPEAGIPRCATSARPVNKRAVHGSERRRER
jgi:hypothetical protein